MRHLKELGIEVRFEEQNINTLSGDGELMLTIFASFAQEESRGMSESIQWSKQKTQAKGKMTNGSVPYGYRYSDGNVTIDLSGRGRSNLMSKAETIYEAIDDIDDKYLVEAFEYKKKRPVFKVIAAAAACLCICIAIRSFYNSDILVLHQETENVPACENGEDADIIGNDDNSGEEDNYRIEGTLSEKTISEITGFAKAWYVSHSYEIISIIPDYKETERQEYDYKDYNADEILVFRVKVKDDESERYITIGSKDGWQNCEVLNEGY